MITILSACLRCLRDPLSLLKDRVWLKTFRKLQHSIRVEGRREKTEIGNFLNFWSPIVWKLHLEHYPLISIHSIGTKLRLGKVFGNLLRPRTRNLQMPRMYTTWSILTNYEKRQKNSRFATNVFTWVYNSKESRVLRCSCSYQLPFSATFHLHDIFPSM